MNLRKVATIATSLVMLAPLSALASTTQTFLTLNGDTNASVGKGDTVEAKLQFNNTGNSTVQSVWVEIPGSGFPGECLDVEDQNQTGPHTVTFNVNTTGASEGIWDIKTTRYGIDSPGTGANNDCDSTIGSNSSHTFFSQLTITSGQSTGNNSNNTGGGNSGHATGTTDPLAAIMTALQAIITKLTAAPAPTPVPTTSAACVAYAQAAAGSMPGARNDANVRLQGFLLSQGAQIPALAAGASFGFDGPQTEAARSGFVAQNHCY